MAYVIVLAGGYARRFQKKGERWVDKLLVEFEGEPIIKRVLEAISPIAHEIIISTDNKRRGEKYKEFIKGAKVKIAVDRFDFNCDGPLRGIATAINFTKRGKVIVIPGDMPFIRAETMMNLMERMGDYDIATPIWNDGSIESLVFVAKRNALKKYSNFLCFHGYWRATGIQRISLATIYVPVNELTKNPNEFFDVNYRDDLLRKPNFEIKKGVQIHIKFDSDLKDDADLAFKKGHYFLAALKYFKSNFRASRYRSIKAFEKEADFYFSRGLRVLAIQALEDIAKVLNKLGLNILAHYYQRKAMGFRKLKY